MSILRSIRSPRRSKSPATWVTVPNSAPATRVTAMGTVVGEPRRSATCLKHGEAAQLSATRREEPGDDDARPVRRDGLRLGLACSLAGGQARTWRAGTWR